MAWNLNVFKQFLLDLGTSMKKNAAYFKDKGKVDRAARVVAMIAYLPDLKASQAEVTRGLQSIHKTLDGDAFDIGEMRSLVQGYVKELEAEPDKDIAKLAMFQKIGAVTEETGKWLIEIALLVAKAEAEPGDSDPFSAKEKELVKEICAKFKIDPSPYVP